MKNQLDIGGSLLLAGSGGEKTRFYPATGGGSRKNWIGTERGRAGLEEFLRCKMIGVVGNMEDLLPSTFEQRVAKNGCAYRINGLGTPELVFVHGFGCAGEDWDDVVGHLSRTSTCLTLDLPGHGLSSFVRPASIEKFATAVNEIVAEAGIENPLLVGHSLGTKVVRACYRQSPDSIGGLVLVDGSTYVGGADTLIGKLRADMARAGHDAYLRNLFAGMFIAGSDAAFIERMTARALRLDPAFATEVLIDSIRWDIHFGDDVLRSLGCPLLLIQSTYFSAGIGRTFMTPEVETPFMAKVAQLVGTSECQVMTGVGHFPMIEKPADVSARIRRFVRAIPRKRHGPS